MRSSFCAAGPNASRTCMFLTQPAHCRRGQCTSMVDDFEGREARSSRELWTEICSSLPEVRAEAAPERDAEFTDSFQPAAQVHVNGQSNGTDARSPSALWEPMEDSETYIASLGTDVPSAPFLTLGLMLRLSLLVSIHLITGAPFTLHSQSWCVVCVYLLQCAIIYCHDVFNFIRVAGMCVSQRKCSVLFQNSPFFS